MVLGSWFVWNYPIMCNVRYGCGYSFQQGEADNVKVWKWGAIHEVLRS